ncbi:MAG TPA: polyphosphate kinase 1 [Thermoanaerobaculia bacterium]|nr:polyphosphate kinase 1 [Thermoanaerobaculia bacterium]
MNDAAAESELAKVITPEGEFPPATSPGSLKVPAIALASEPVKLLNRELSWLEFNRRVLAEAENPEVPLLERLKFLAITANNLDEFLMVRVGSIHEMIRANITERSPDGLTPKQQLKALREGITRLLNDMYRCLNETIVPQLGAHGIKIDRVQDLPKKEQQLLQVHFEKQIAPILTALAIDPSHPFPFLSNLEMNLGVVLESDRGEEHIAILKVPSTLPRLITIPEISSYVRIENLIGAHLSMFFPGLAVRRHVPFRLIRNGDTALREDEVQDLLVSVESELKRRERRDVVWIEIAAEQAESIAGLLTAALRVSPDDVYYAPSFLKMFDLIQISQAPGKSSLHDAPFNPRLPAQLATSEDIFSIIRKGDILLHRPYDSFAAVVEFIQTAAEDPDVVAIKQTLYRTDRGSVIIDALAAAAVRGKQVTAVVELQARFDESKNIEWARRLEQAGVQVVYGLLGIKTHCKLCLVVRREGGELRRYVHLSTGNYNARTSAIYTDIDLFTHEETFGEDASQLMNLLTGFSLASVQEIFERQVSYLQWKRLVVAPIDYHRWLLLKIEREIEHASAGRPAQIIAKLNALVDPTAIQALYKASQAGVKIDLIIRGICSLVPGVPGLSENIKVMSVIDRFLEHSRIILFRNGGETEIFVTSGDWMPRNFFRRIELVFPILAEPLKRRIEDEILATTLGDRVKAWRLHPDGSYRRRSIDDKPALRSQDRFIELARANSVRVGNYEEALSKPAALRRKAKKAKKKKS